MDLIRDDERQFILSLKSNDQVIAELCGTYEAIANGCKALRGDPNADFESDMKLLEFIARGHYLFCLIASHPMALGGVKLLRKMFKSHRSLWQDASPFIQKLQDKSSEHILDALSFISSEALFLQEASSTPFWTIDNISKYRTHIDDHATARLYWHKRPIQQYTQLADRHPTTGRLYSYVAILRQEEHIEMVLALMKSHADVKGLDVARFVEIYLILLQALASRFH
jgi:hypothetical protein